MIITAMLEHASVPENPLIAAATPLGPVRPGLRFMLSHPAHVLALGLVVFSFLVIASTMLLERHLRRTAS